MARQPFGGNVAVLDSSTGQPLVGHTCTVWTAETGGTRLMDLQTVGGTPISNGEITTLDYGKVPQFLGPDGMDEVWLDTGVSRFLLESTNMTERMTQAESTLASLVSRMGTVESGLAAATRTLDGGTPSVSTFTFKVRNGTANEWTSANPVLAKGEIGWETTSNRFKVGDGVTTWGSLFYYGSTPVSPPSPPPPPPPPPPPGPPPPPPPPPAGTSTFPRPAATVTLNPTTNFANAMNALGPGSVAYLNAGTYGDYGMVHYLSTAGTSGSRIQVYAAPGASVRILGFVHIAAGYWTFGDIHFQGPTGPGTGTGAPNGEEVQMWLNGGNTTLHNCYITDNLYKCAVYVDTSNNIIDSCWVYNNGTWDDPNQEQDGGVANNIDHGLYIQAGADNIIRNCLIEHNLATGVHVWPNATGTKIVNNTFYDNAYGSNGGHIMLAGGTSGSRVFNNIFHTTRGRSVFLFNLTGTDNQVAYNLSYAANAGHFQTGSGVTYSNNWTGLNPNFTTANGTHYYLASGSPAVNVGVSTFGGFAAPTVDGLNRPRVGAYDLGAYERQ